MNIKIFTSHLEKRDFDFVWYWFYEKKKYKYQLKSINNHVIMKFIKNNI